MSKVVSNLPSLEDIIVLVPLMFIECEIALAGEILMLVNRSSTMWNSGVVLFTIGIATFLGTVGWMKSLSR